MQVSRQLQGRREPSLAPSDSCTRRRVRMRSWWTGATTRALESSMRWLGWDVWTPWASSARSWCRRPTSGRWRKSPERTRTSAVPTATPPRLLASRFDLLIDLNNNFNVVSVICVFHDRSYHKFNSVRLCCRCSWIHDFEFSVSVMKWSDVASQKYYVKFLTKSKIWCFIFICHSSLTWTSISALIVSSKDEHWTEGYHNCFETRHVMV